MKRSITAIITIALFISHAVFAAMDAKSLFEQGTEAFKSGNYGSAELLFKKVVDSGDDELIDQAWFYLARSIFGKEQYESAIFEFKRFLSRCKTEQLSTESRYWMGESYYRISSYPNAIEEFRRFIAISAKPELVAEAHGLIGRIYRAQKRYDEAIIEWEAAISASGSASKKAVSNLWIGEALFSNGRYDEALQRLSALLAGTADQNTYAQARVILGRIWQRKKNHQMALQVFNGIPDAFLKETPFDEVLFFKARSYIALGNTVMARNLLDLFLATGKKSAWFYYALYAKGKILVLGTGKDEGLKIFEQVRAESNKTELRSWASRRLASTYLVSMPVKAVPYLEESLKTTKSEKRSDLLILLGRTCLKAKLYDKALEYFDIFLKENPFDKGRDEVNFIKARVHLEKGEVERAIRIFETIRTDNPFSKFNTESNYYLALISYKKGDAGKAITLLREYSKHKSGENLYDAQVLMMQAYLQKNDTDNAGKICDLLIRDYITMKDVEAVLLEYALALIKKGRDAQRYIKLILSKFPESETTAEIYFMNGNDNFNRAAYDAALDNFNRYLTTGYTTNRGIAFYRRIVSLYNLRRYNEVIAIIKKGNFPPMNESQWNEIPLIQARSYFNQKKFDEVYMSMDARNLAKYPRTDIFMFIKCSLHVGDHRAAMMANEYLEKDKPLYAESLYLIGNYYVKNVNRDEAELFFTKIVNDCPGTRFVDHARVSQAELLFLNHKYQTALNLLSDVNGVEVQGRKDSLIVACLFEMNLDEKAVAFTRERLDGLIAAEYGELAIKYNVKYYYEKKDLQQFELFIKYLSRFKGNEDLVNHYSGRIYFETGNYYRAYNSFTALSRTQNRYLDEALFYLGVFNLHLNRSVPAAVSCFTRLCDMREADKTLQLKAMIHLAVIYHEMNDDKTARGYLDRVLASSERGLPHVQAGNIYESFKYDTGRNQN